MLLYLFNINNVIIYNNASVMTKKSFPIYIPNQYIEPLNENLKALIKKANAKGGLFILEKKYLFNAIINKVGAVDPVEYYKDFRYKKELGIKTNARLTKKNEELFGRNMTLLKEYADSHGHHQPTTKSLFYYMLAKGLPISLDEIIKALL